jgi:HK97 gp10 family phage protein
MIEVKIEGLDALRERLLALPKEMQQGPVKAATRAAAKVVARAAKRRAPIDSGVLEKAIYVTRSKSGSSDVQEMAIVGVRFGRKYQRRGMDAWYWRFLEFGTSKMPAQPFLRPAFVETRAQQLQAMRDALIKGLDRAARKLLVTKR